MKIGDRCTSAYTVSFYGSNGHRGHYRGEKRIHGLFLGYTYKQFGEPVGNQEWTGGFYDKSIKVAVIMPVHGESYRKPVYALPDDVEPAKP